MSLNALGLGFVFTARDLASGTIHRVGGAFGALDRNAMRSAASYQRNIAVMGAGLAVMGAGAATLAGAFGLAEAASHFDQGLARVGAIARASSEDMVLLRQAAIDAGIATQFSPTEAVEGLGALAQQGFNTAQAIGLLEPVLDLAAGGMIGVEEAAQSVTAAVHVFGLSADDAGHVADQLLRITNMTALAAGDMELAIGTVARGARLTHQTIEEMLPAVGLLRNTGVDVSVASQSVSSALTFMASRADQIRQTLGVDLVETLEDGTQRFRPFMDIALEAGEALETRFADPAERTATAVELFSRFGVGAVTGVFESLRNGVTDSEGVIHRGADAIAFLRHSMGDGAVGAAEEFRSRLLDTFEGQQTLLRGSMQTLGVVVGEGFTRGLRPYVSGTIDLVNRAIAVFNEIPVEIRGAMASVVVALGGATFAMGAIIALGAAIALIAPFVQAIAVAIGGLLLAMAPFAAVGASIFAMGYAVQRLILTNDRFARSVQRTFESARLAVRGLVQLFTTGELSGAIAEDLSRAENEGILRFIVDLYAIGFRVVQFFRGIGAGFEAGLGTLGPSVDRMVSAFERLGVALGFASEGSREFVAGSPSKEFINTGARVGAFLAGVVEIIVDLTSMFARFMTGFIQGWQEFSEGATVGLDALGPSFTFLVEQVEDLLVAFGVLGADTKGEDGMVRFGRALGFIGGLILDFISFNIAGLAYGIGGVVWFVGRMVRAFAVLPALFSAVGLAARTMFMNILESFRTLIDTMIARTGALASLVPPELRPASLGKLIEAGDAARARVATRTTEGDARRRSTAASIAGLGASPAVAEAESRAAGEGRTEAALAAVAGVLEQQGRERGAQPWEVSIAVDGEALARATGRGERRDTAASFGLTPAEE